MIKRRLTWMIVLLAVALLLSATPALASDGLPDGGITVWGDYTVKAGESVEGDLVVFNGDVTVEGGGTVKGSLIVWNGSADVEGTIGGNLVVTNGDIRLGSGAQVKRDLICGGNCDLEQEEGAHIDGSIIERIPVPPIPRIRFNGGEIPGPVVPPVNVRVPDLGWFAGLVIGFVRRVVSVVLVAALAALVGLLLPQQVESVGQTLVKAPVPSFGYGLLTAFAATAAIVVLAITICFSPVAFLAAVALFAAGLYGWICFGAVIGKRLLDAFKAGEVAPAWIAGLGTLVVTSIVALIDTGLSILCCLQPLIWLTVFVVGCAGLGAVVATRFGTQIYPPPASASTPVEASESSESDVEEPAND